MTENEAIEALKLEGGLEITGRQIRVAKFFEGIYVANCKDCNAPFGCDACPDEGYNEIDEFVELWNSTVKKSDIDRYGWDANPYVWVIEFERCEKPEGV